MAKKNRENILLDNGQTVEASLPVIVSASRSTDIPAFYADWFFHRLKKGYSAWRNPYNGLNYYVGYRDTRFIVFWSKNPYNLIKHLDELKRQNIGCYIQFTLNDYVEEGLEQGVPTVDFRINTFKKLVEILGKGHVIWRFDPLILTDKIGVEELLGKIENIGDKLKGYTEKLIFSFIDILSYSKVKRNLEKENVRYIDWSEDMMNEFAKRLAQLNKKWNYQLATCGEKIDISKYGIEHNKCIDDELIIRLAYKDAKLMEYLGVELIDVRSGDLFGSITIPEGAIRVDNGIYAVKSSKKNKAQGQREFCGCIESRNIGEYNTCIHKCVYCYANTSKEQAALMWERHKENPYADNITGL